MVKERSIDLRRKLSREEKIREINRRREYLASIGLSEEQIVRISKYIPKLPKIDRAANYLELFKRNRSNYDRALIDVAIYFTSGHKYSKKIRPSVVRTRSIDLRLRSSRRYRINEIQRRKNYLFEVGMSQNQITRIQRKRSTLWPEEVVDNYLIKLQAIGFEYNRAVRTVASILAGGNSISRIFRKIKESEKKKETRATESENIRDYLIKRGFTQGQVDHLSKKHPKLWPMQVIDNYFKNFEEMEFDPLKINNILFTVLDLGMSVQNLRKKIEGLEKRQFNNPKKLIEKSAMLLGRSFENIDQRLRLFRIIIKRYTLPYKNAQQMMETNLLLFSTSLEKIKLLILVAGVLRIRPEELTPHIINIALRVNIENVLVAMDGTNTGVNTGSLIYIANKVGQTELTREEKRGIIFESSKIPNKIKDLYRRGYPK